MYWGKKMLGLCLPGLLGVIACDSKSLDIRSKSQEQQAPTSTAVSAETSDASPAGKSDAVVNADAEKVTAPINVSGSYLVCQINDKDLATTNRADVSCRVTEANSTNKASLEKAYTKASFSYQLPDDPNIKVLGMLADPASADHVLFSFQNAVAPLALDAVHKFRVMFQANPLQAAADQLIFAARTAKGPEANAALPEDFAVYFGNGVVVNNPSPGLERRLLPTANISYRPVDGCYIACYSNSASNAAYPITDTVFVMGQFRVQGLYAGRACNAKGFESSTNIDQIPEFKAACAKYIPACAGNICWGGNDTGGWYGLQ